MTPKLRPQAAPSLADHPNATMSSITLNVNAVKVKYTTHMEEIDRLESVYKLQAEAEPTGKPKKKFNRTKTKQNIALISPMSKAGEESGRPGLSEEEEAYRRVICLIPAPLHVYILQYDGG